MDCEWNEWGQWQRHSCRCFKDKGKPGKKYRTRDRKVTEDFGGKQCLKLNKKPLSEGKFMISMMKASIDGDGTRFHFFISETKRDFD